jgi:hypothetical protein
MTLPHLLSRALQAQRSDSSVRAVFPLSEWRLEAAAESRDFILTMRTPDGFEVAFSLSAATLAGMTSVVEKHSPITEQGLPGLLPDWR